MGLDRVVLSLLEAGHAEPPFSPGVFVALSDTVGLGAAWKLARELRAGGTTVVMGGGRSLKAQMRQAQKLGAACVAMFGEQEIAEGTVTIRDMAAAEQTQLNVLVAAAAIEGVVRRAAVRSEPRPPVPRKPEDDR